MQTWIPHNFQWIKQTQYLGHNQGNSSLYGTIDFKNRDWKQSGYRNRGGYRKMFGQLFGNKWWKSHVPFHVELTSMGPILLRGNKIVIPRNLRYQLLELAHEGRPGESVIKQKLRSKVWWPLLDREAEKFVKCCYECLLVMQPNKPIPWRKSSSHLDHGSIWPSIIC